MIQEKTKSFDSERKQPASPEIEAAVLGGMLLEKEAVPKVIELITADCFYDNRHQFIFEAIVNLFSSNEPIDSVTVYEELRKSGKLEPAGGAVFLAKLTQDIASAANIEYYSKIILEKWILRKLISTSFSIANSAFEASEDVFDLLDKAETEIFKITEKGLKESYKSMDKAVREAIEHIEAVHSRKNVSFSVSTGMTMLDEMLGGFQKTDLIIIAARPSMGKTAFALSVARNAAVDYKVPVAIFSLEMATIQLVTRLICAEAKIDAHSVRTGKFKAEEGSRISKTAHKLMQAPIYVDDTPSQTVLEIRAKCRRMKIERNIGLVIIDYLQLMTSAGKVENREREIANISRSLKALAKELNLPVIALSQLNRSVESSSDKKPMLSHLRESGSIEQDADVVMFLYRPEAYQITTFQDGSSTAGLAEVIIAKQRNGPTGDVRVRFVKEYARYENYDPFHSDPGIPVRSQDSEYPI